MNRVFHIVTVFICGLAFQPAMAQSLSGITKAADTSFNIAAEYRKHIKKFSNIEVVKKNSSSAVVEQSNIVFCLKGNRKLRLDVFLPPGKFSSKRAAIIIIHGGGWRSGNKEQHHPLAQRLAEKGYVVFTPEYRLSTEALYPAAVYDVKAAIRWVRAHAEKFRINKSQVVLAGFSAGGQLAALAGATNGNKRFESKNCNTQASSEVNAIIDIDGTLSFVHPDSGEGDDSKKLSAATLWFGYSKKENYSLWEDASPLKHVDQHTPPTLFINSSVDRMHAGRDDFMKQLRQHRIYTDVRSFSEAPHSFPFFHPWFERTVEYMDEFLEKVFGPASLKAKKIVVAKDGSGDHTSVQAAFDAVPVNNTETVTIFIRNGTYFEKLRLDSSKKFVSLLGEDKFKTILTYNDHSGKVGANGDTLNTFTSYSFYVGADNFSAKNISFENTAGNSAGQAVAMHIMGDKVKLENCRFLGHQDVLYAGKPASRQYFDDCYIEGTTDFIFGPSVAWFEQCHINSKRNSHITAASTPQQQEFGYVFNDCILTSDSLHVNKVSLGRPWRPYSNVVYINCYMGPHIIAEGWNNWRNPENEKTARYAEYNSYGPGANPSRRFPWTKQLNSDEVKKFTLENVFGNWNLKSE